MAMSEEEIKLVKETKKVGFKHVEAFKLMTYQDEQEPSYKEVIWNSRDGVTPFMISSKDGKRRLKHTDWRNDPHAPYYTPQIGERVFCDLTVERSTEKVRLFLTSMKVAADSGNEKARQEYDEIPKQYPFATTKEDAYNLFVKDRAELIRPGEPDIFEVDQAFLDRLAESRKNIVASDQAPLFEGPIRITAMMMRALDNAKKKGFIPTNERGEVTWFNIAERLLYVVTEVTEATEIYRKREGDSFECLRERWNSIETGPQGFGSELADIVIRVAGLAAAIGIDLEEEIREKMQYNLTRPYQHGKKYGEK